MNRRGIRRTCEGFITSDKMDKTVVVEVRRLTAHPLYGKVLRRTSRLKAHDENNECRVGDYVMLAECRPLSKEKNWRVVQVLARSE